MAGIFERFGKHLRHLPEDLAQYDDEFLCYCVEREQVEQMSLLRQQYDMSRVCRRYGC